MDENILIALYLSFSKEISSLQQQQHPYLQIDGQQQQQQQQQQQPQHAYLQYNGNSTQYPVTTAILNGHSHGISGSPLTTAQSPSSEGGTVAVQTRIGGAASLPMAASGMYGEESGFTDLFNAAAVVSNEETLLMGMSFLRITIDRACSKHNDYLRLLLYMPFIWQHVPRNDYSKKTLII